MRELHKRRFRCARTGAVCALFVLAWGADGANAQFYGSIGGVGRSIDPGRLHSVRGLRTIGGFQQVGSNPVLQSRYSAPTAPLSIGDMSRQTGGRGRRDYNEYSTDAGVQSLRSAASNRMTSYIDTREDSMRTYSMLAGELGRTYMDTWQNRGVSIIGQGFLGQDTSFAPTSGIVAQNQPRSRMVPRTDMWGRTSYIGASLGSLRGALGPAQYSGFASNRFRPLNEGVYHAAEVAVRQNRERPAGDEKLLPAQNVSLDEVITARLQRRLDSYVQRGWDQFKARRYSDAYNSFVLASSVRSDAPEARIGVILSAIATSQYIAASNALRSMVEHNRNVVLQQAVDMRAKYGNDADFTAHYRALQDYVTTSPASNLQALYAYILWGNGDRVGAVTNAAKAAEETPAGNPLTVLADLMRSKASEAPAGTRG